MNLGTTRRVAPVLALLLAGAAGCDDTTCRLCGAVQARDPSAVRTLLAAGEPVTPYVQETAVARADWIGRSDAEPRDREILELLIQAGDPNAFWTVTSGRARGCVEADARPLFGGPTAPGLWRLSVGYYGRTVRHWIRATNDSGGRPVTLTFNRPATDTLVVAAEGTLDDRNVGPLLAEGYKTIDEGVTRVVIDCSKLRYISSFGLGAMVRLHKRLADRGHRLTLAAVSPHLATQLRLVRLSDVFARAPSVDAALEEPTARR